MFLSLGGRWRWAPAAALAVGLLAMAGCASHPAAGAAQKAGTGVTRATLSNGLRVILVRNTLAPTVTTMLNYIVGGNETPKGYPGAAHAQEHMMFRGSPGLTGDQLNEISGAMGGFFNADTQNAVTQYFFTVPAQDLEIALNIAALRMKAVNDSPADWAHERGAIEQEVSSDYSNPGFHFYMQMRHAMFRGTPLAHTALGTRPSFNKLTAAMIHRFWEQWYAANNAVLVVAGDFDPATAMAKIRELFSPIPRKQLPARPAIQLRPVKPQALHLTSDYPYGVAYAAYRLPGTASPDYAATQVMSDVLSSQRGTLYGLVPEGKAFVAGFQLQAMKAASVGMAFAAYPGNASGDALIADMKQIVAADLKNGFPADLVAAAKRDELLSSELQKNSAEGLAGAWSQAVAVEGRHSPLDDLHAMQRVTVAQVNRVAREYLRPEHVITAVLAPHPSGKPVSQHGFGGAESFAPKHVKPVPLPTWAAGLLTRLEIPRRTVDPVVTHLANGLTLIVQPETVSDTVSVYGHIRQNADLESAAGQKGVSDVLGDLFSYGTTKLNRLAFQQALDRIGANESAGQDFSLQVLASHFDRGLQLLAANELEPGLPGHAFQVVRMQEAGMAAGQLKSPGYLAGRAMTKALMPAGDPTLRQDLPGHIGHLTLADVRGYYGKAFRPDLTTIVVIGQVTPADAQAAVEKYFGGWKAVGPAPNTVLPPVPENQASATHVPDPSRVQDSVSLAETVGINRFSPDYYALQLGNYVLGGGLFASRLYRDLRVNTGLVYYVGTRLAANRSRASYHVSFGCDPPNVAKARAIVERDIKEMGSEPVSADQLREAKAVLLRQIPLSESSVDSIAEGWLSRAELGLPLDEPYTAARAYLHMTAAEVQAAFHKRIRAGRLAQVVQGPAPE